MTQGQRANIQAEKVLEQIEALDTRVKASAADLDAASQLQTLGLLTGAIAHEFNNILTPILSYTKVALDAPEDQALCRRALERAAQGAERASRIATSVLRLAGRGLGEDERCSPAAALQAAVDCLPTPLDELGIDLHADLPRSLHAAMPQTDLEHIFLNLLLNAARALGSGGGAIRIELDSAAAGECSTWNTAGWATITFRDDGPGVPSHLAADLFNPVPTRPAKGERPTRKGLGLVICRQLLEAVGGSIALEPTRSRGAAFALRLPLAPASHAAA